MIVHVDQLLAQCKLYNFPPMTFTLFLNNFYLCRLSTNTGIRAVDIGMPQLSMHSIREMMGCVDLTHAYQLFRTYLKDFRKIDSSLRL